MKIATPLGKDYLLINRFTAKEGISELFTIDAELLHEEETAGYTPTQIDPKALLGKGVTIEVTSGDGATRQFAGMVSKFAQGIRDVRFTVYYITIVPHIWLLTQKSQSQIFQQMSVPDILKKVFKDFLVKFELQGTFEPRNYCVQYRETDWDFASRLMEEEGIYYYFKHADGKDQMIIANTPQSHPECPSKSQIKFHRVGEEEGFYGTISKFSNDYRVQTGKVALWDFNFQLPTTHLDTEKVSIHQYGDNQKLEMYDFPAGYARKYDGIEKGGSEQAGELNKVFQDREKTINEMMQALDSRVTSASAGSDCCAITSGYRFALSNHPNSSLNGQYVITSATHEAEQNPSYVSAEATPEPYTNNFSCIAYGSGAVPFRPLRKTAKPIIYGSQTAIVVGPAGEEIFTDKYGRVKVQFHWDRDGQVDASSSCWLRVAQMWAGNKWGTMFIPRIGMEVLVNFLEGDPDQPIIVGCVYNPQTMPPYTLPDHKTKSTIKSNSSKGGAGFNEIRFEDKKGSEQIFFHGQKDQDIRIRNNRRELIGNDRHLIVKRDKRDKIDRDEHILIKRDLIEKIERDYHRKVEGKAAFKTEGSFSHDIGGAAIERVGGSHNIEVTGDFMVNAQNIVLEAKTGLTIKVGGNFVTINPGGVQINGTMVLINSGGAPLPYIPAIPVPPLNPTEAEIADNADPGSDAPTYRNQRRQTPPSIVPSYTKPWHNPKDPKNKDKTSWVEIKIVDEDGDPVVGERYRVTLPDGETLAEGTTDEKGYAKVTNIDPGSCKITFPRIDGRAWKKK
jgi:type VI secretion system secreted protein VgrG